jgi:diguanylate cyclase (GGDEF)-like protein/PAS domain S-box-containing protein
MNLNFHPILARQLHKLGLDAQRLPDSESWLKLLFFIEQTYQEAKKDSYALERTLSISSKEMQSLYQQQKSAYEARLQALVNATNDLIWMKDADGVYLFCNTMFERFFNAPQSEILGKTDYDFVNKELADYFRQQDFAAMSKGTSNGNEEWLDFGDHSYNGLFETLKTPVYNESGKLLGVMGIARDITERKKLESELRIAATAFEAHVGIIVTDTERKILRVNKSFTEISGYSQEELIGQNPSILQSGRHDESFYQEMWNKIVRSGFWQGEIWDRRKNGEVYPKWMTISSVKDAEGTVTHYVSTQHDISERKAAEDKIWTLDFLDPLTRLPNRKLLLDRLQQAMSSSARSNIRGALLLIDLDDFKSINDTLGHEMGDFLLQQVALRLVISIRDCDSVARTGGDEFVILLEGLGGSDKDAAEQTEAVGEKILATLNKPFQLGSYEYHCSSSIGMSLFKDAQQGNEEIFKQADIAMYQAKKSGRNTLRFFDPKVQEMISARALLERELRKAIERQQLQLHYQIQVDSAYRPTGAEVLIRWAHPERGMVSPAHFIPLAEETGLILPIGLWVLETACAQLKLWEQEVQTRDLILSVNVSVKQFRQPHFAAQVEQVVQNHGINPTRLKLELTESMLMDDIETMILTMSAINNMGIRFSLDDFGTGYSSLQYLKRLPLTQLKIDQSFVRDLVSDDSDKAIVRTIIAMAHSLKLKVIAEGVETEEQRQLLFNKGCAHYQGYLFGKPVPIKEFEASLGKVLF